MMSYRLSLHFAPWTLKFGQIFSCHHFFSLYLEILTWFFGILVYNDELQIKFTFCSGPMIFGRVMALGLWNLAQIFSCHHFFSLCLEILTWFFGIWVYNDELQIKFTFCSGSMIFGRVMALGLWILAHIFSCHQLFSLCLEILTWFLVFECIVMSYRSSLHFAPIQWFLAELWPLDFEFWPNI
jgi:hypothetical protein